MNAKMNIEKRIKTLEDLMSIQEELEPDWDSLTKQEHDLLIEYARIDIHYFWKINRIGDSRTTKIRPSEWVLDPDLLTEEEREIRDKALEIWSKVKWRRKRYEGIH